MYVSSRRTFLRHSALFAFAPQIRIPEHPDGRNNTPEQALRRWIALGLRCVARTSATPPRAARGLALLSIGLQAAITTGGSNTVSALAGVASPLLRASFPLAQMIGLPIDAAIPTTAAARRAYERGAVIAQALLTYTADDGAAEAPSFEAPLSAPARPGIWEPTPHKFMAGIEPAWGQIRPFVLAHGADVRAETLPAWESQAFDAVRQQFADAQQQSDADRALARRWAYGVNTVTPVGAWFEIALDLAARANMPLLKAARTYALLSVTLHDACIACWESKYHYRLARPVQWMAQAVPGWSPIIDTPPHPSYPSGHATFSSAAAKLLGGIFPSAADELRRMAEEAAYSRIVGGIHWPIDSSAGLQQGHRVAQRMQEDAPAFLKSWSVQ